MMQNVSRTIYTMKRTPNNRVPIPLTTKENEELQQFAEKEFRSKQSMAGIIYRLGMEAYRNNGKPNQQSQ
jgi:uncharacterized protein HemY